MKVFKPNKTNVGDYSNIEHLIATAKKCVMDFVKINDEHIHYVKSEQDGNLLKCLMHPFVQAVHFAYSSHLPLIISPDMIWYLISSATAQHINKNSEELRYKFVNHEGKKIIEIRRDDFVLKSLSNPWHEVIDDFSTKIVELTKNDIADTIIADFSTTTKDARVVSQIVLMDAMQKYFEYHFSTLCGIPEFRIKGTQQDWEKVKNKTKKIIEIIPEFQKWYDNGLKEILDNFIKVFDDKIDNDFWNQIYKVNGGSGGPFVTGWILALFPYLSENPNRYVWNDSWKDSVNGDFFAGVKTSSFDYHMNQVPFKWKYFSQEIDMLFVGGLVGVIIEKDKALLPIFGYAITEDKAKTNSKN